ncbi:hypothetical protein IG193_00085 [Infirmifilum lucidum]|uniref:Uncharacterized protein n=1 Tax=Infirmifilum lucidum TaxID=2776706 RepID=A0A7L9FIP8_9CREN|nr:hypothetical protein [Infirmifilum lucidum]QOJ78903.1 hypothetical protein IG193_00085 [Infirmifilum lucidum]
MSFEAEEGRGWGTRVAAAVFSAISSAVTALALLLAGSYVAGLLGVYAVRAPQLELVLLTVALASSLAVAGRLLEESPVSVVLSLLSRLVGLYAFLLGLGGTELKLSLQGVEAQLDLSPIVAVLLAGAVLVSLVDAYSWASK